MPSAVAGTIDTAFIEQPWPKQWVKEYEVGRHQVRWRQRATKREGIFGGVRFVAPLPRAAMWDRATDFADIGRLTPGVVAVRILEDTTQRQVLEVDVEVFWKRLTLRFEVERDPPDAIRFRLQNPALGEYRGVAVFEELAAGPSAAGTTVELSTWLQPAHPVPIGAVVLLERMTMLHGVRNFLKACEQSAGSPPGGT